MPVVRQTRLANVADEPSRLSVTCGAGLPRPSPGRRATRTVLRSQSCVVTIFSLPSVPTPWVANLADRAVRSIDPTRWVQKAGSSSATLGHTSHPFHMLKSSRHSKITGNFGEALILYWLSKRGFECANVDHTGIDLIARRARESRLFGGGKCLERRDPHLSPGAVSISQDGGWVPHDTRDQVVDYYLTSILDGCRSQEVRTPYVTWLVRGVDFRSAGLWESLR